MSRTKRRVPRYGWSWTLRDLEEWNDLYLQFIRGHRPGNDVKHPMRHGGWWDCDDIPGRNCASAKRYQKRRTSKMRRREADRELKRYYDE